MKARLILASASPRRRELLDQIGVGYRARPVMLDETPHTDEAPLAYVQRVAAEKSRLCRTQSSENLPILAADTAVVVEQRILGKPKDQAQCLAMLSLLSGTTHQVYTAVSLQGREHWQAVSITEVTFRTLTRQEMLAYWRSKEPADKAGAYAIQGLGAVFVESIKGSFSGVVGLPIFETVQLLSKQGIHIFK
ncbi:MAG: septum formation protein Maf [Gammaproteobacteria bacterium HGW-Gammaproteobacteria-3]|nr:MAG: septum formation protein Maf [Gammaproteobacteria bacterium HGW-Gammaproteobacteria-3]